MHTVDILLPTYNGEAYIEEQINSLLNQTYTNIKIIIRDDGSTDKTNEIIQEVAKKDSRIIINIGIKNNLGLVGNINYLLGISNSNYIMFCDQDDVWFVNKVEVLLNELQRMESELNKNTPILSHSDCFVTDEYLNGRDLFKGSKPLQYGLRNSLFKFYVQGASVIFNLSLKNEIYPFISNVYLHDRYTHLVVEIVGSRSYINAPLMYYRQHSKNLVGSSSLFNKIKNTLILKNFNYFQNKDRNLIKSLYDEKYPDNKFLGNYLRITSRDLSVFEKLRLLKKYKISMRFKEFIIMILKC